MSEERTAFARTYGLAAGVLYAVAIGAIAVLALTDVFVDAVGALVVSVSLGTGVLAYRDLLQGPTTT